MSARTWRDGDPEPDEHPPLIDAEGVTWLWDDGDESDIPSYARRKITHYPGVNGGPGVVIGSPIGLDWGEITGEFGPLREATDEEMGVFTVAYAAKPLGVA